MLEQSAHFVQLCLLNEVVAELQRTAEAVDASALNEPRLRSVLPELVLGRPVVMKVTLSRFERGRHGASSSFDSPWSMTHR